MKELEQISLFTIDEVKKTSYLHILNNGEVKDMSMQELFDTERFNRIRAISFVASPKFFFQMTNGFEEVQLILGIEDGQVVGSFTTGLQSLLAIDKRIEVFQSFSEDVQELLIKDQYRIRYSKKNDPIHSKLYLLDGLGDTRLMVGSANFTETAFSQRKQYEELLVFDNSSLFNVYSQRYEDIYSQTVDYIPEKLKRTILGEPINIGNADQVFEVLMEEIKRGAVIAEFTETQIEELKIAGQQVQKKVEDFNQLDQVIEIITKKDRKTGHRILLPAAQIEKKKAVLKSKLSRLNKRTEEVDIRSFIEYYESNHVLYKKANDQTLLPFSKAAEIDEIKIQLKLIHAFIAAYKDFTIQSDGNTQKRIFEAILYSFVSAHIWKMRDHYVLAEGRGSVRRDIPLFLVLAGRTSSGKTTALEFINLLIGNSNSYFSFEQINKKNMVLDFFKTSNVSPVLVDEVDSKFFTSSAADKGERLIKDVTNNLEGKHPVFICTTNTTNFDATAQIISRIYYLQIDNTFDKQKQAASSKFLGEIMSKVNDVLYKDFTYRLSDRIKHGETFYRTDDFLAIAREIFEEYHEMSDLPIPVWFSKQKFDDYNERGKKIWKELLISNRDSFDIRNDNTVFVRLEDLGKRTKREREEIINYLPPESIIEDNTVLILNKEIFMRFIGQRSNPSLWRKWFKL